MNLSLTNECNRRCKFCFQKNWYLSKEKTELSIDNVERFIQWYVPKYFKVIGGEPLLYSKFPELLELVRKYNKKVGIISNCTLDSKIIIENKDVISGILINSHYRPKEREIFLNNIKNFTKYNIPYSISYTLIPNGLRNKSIENAINRFKDIFRLIPNDKMIIIRLSLMSPDYDNTFTLYDYSIDLVTLLTKLYNLRGNIKITFDCALNACELQPEVFKVLRKINAEFRVGLCDHNSPKDILVDLSMIWCSASKNIRLNNIFDYRNSDDACKEIQKKWREYWLNTEIICHHESCGKYNPGICTGFCAGRNEGLRRLKNAV